MEQRLEVRILGPFEVSNGDRVLDLGGARQRALLARLAVGANQVVGVDTLIEELWGPQAVPGTKQALQAQVSRARRTLGEGRRLVARPPGYILLVGPEELDAASFETLLAQARTAAAEGDLDAATRLWAKAEGLWRGPALIEFADYAFAQAEAARLDEMRLAAADARIAAELSLGRHSELVAQLEALVGAHPYRERLWGHLMVALYRSGRQADALGAYQRVRKLLGEELGIAPGPELATLEEAILLQKSELEWDPSPPSVGQSAARRLSVAEPGSTLPRPRSSFVGRQHDLECLEDLVQLPGLITVVGPGGVGKTRLAIEVARRQAEKSANQTWFVELAGVPNGASLPHTLAAALGIKEDPAQPLLNTFTAFLTDRRALVVLDNCEHIVHAVAVMTDSLLAAAPRLTVLATSREPLRVEGEVVWRTAPLTLPPEDLADRDAAFRCEAVRLFCDRAASHGPFHLREDNTAAVVELCRRLDGIPLALELAAARTAALAPQEIVTRLDDRLSVLSEGRRTAPPRHQTLNAAIDWSYGLLTAEEQILFRRLSVFRGGFTIDAAEQVCDGRGVGRETVVDIVTSLVNKSFLLAETEYEPARFRTLDTLRAYGSRRLADTGESECLHERLLEWELGLAKAASTQLTGRDQQHWMRSIGLEIDNIRSVLLRERNAGGQIAALELVVSLLKYWELHGVKEGREHLEELLRSGGGSFPSDLRVRALNAVGVLAAHQGDHERVRSVYEEALEAARRFSDDEGVERALLGLGHLAYMQGDFGPSRRLCTESLQLARKLGDLRGEAAALHVLGRVAQFQSRLEEAATTLEESLRVRERMGDQDWIAVAVGALAELAFTSGDVDGARMSCERSLVLAVQAGSTHQRAWVTNLLGAIDRADGRFDSATASLEASLEVFRELDDRSCTARGLVRLSQLRRALGEHKPALQLARDGLALAVERGEQLCAIECLEEIAASLTQLGEPLPALVLFACGDRLRSDLQAPVPHRVMAEHDRDVSAARAAAGRDSVSAWESGRHMSLDDARRSAAARIANLFGDP